jgi:tetratricopeptide (TPR) repeat protein
MRLIAILAGLLVLTGSALAAGSDEQYLDIYNEILQADSLQQNGHPETAATRYLQAQTDLQKLQTEHPSWNPDIVKFRLDYLSDKLQALAKFLPATNAPPATAPTAPVAPVASTTQPSAAVESSVAALQQQNAGYQEQVRSLTVANTDLQAKLKEALSVQPAAISPEDLAKAQAKIIALQKERDLLAVALENEKASKVSAIAQAKADATAATVADMKAQAEAEGKKAQAELAMAKEAAAASEKKLADATKELEDLKAARAAEADQNAALKARTAAEEKKTQEEMARLQDASAESEKIMAAASKELELLRTAHPPEIQGNEGAKQIPEESDQLKQLLAQVSKDETEITQLKESVADAGQKLAAANHELETLKAAPPATPSGAPPAENAGALVKERDQLKEELAQRSKDLADAEAHHSQELLSVRAALQEAQQRRDELEKKLAAASSPETAATSTTPPGTVIPPVSQRVEQLQARIAVLEASPVPYTGEELALLKKSPPPVSAEIPKTAPVPPPSGHIHSIKDLPPGSGALWDEAMRASMAGDFDTAEKKYTEVLQQDPTNVYVLAFLANVQFAAGQLAECDKTVQRALASDPADPGSLYLLGLLRYRQDKLDEALDALSLSARYNPTNPATENFLGCVLADKGLRPAAETALRKALQNDPDYSEAHFNLAVVYAGNQPPSLELARWHYKRAVALGHPKSSTLEKLLDETAPPAPAAAPAPTPAPAQ